MRRKTGETPVVAAGGAEIFIGGRSDNFANFKGKIDEVAVYKRALSSEEAATHYRGGQAGKQHFQGFYSRHFSTAGCKWGKHPIPPAIIFGY